MPMVLLDLDGATATLIGKVSRRMLEIRPGLFVGSLSTRAIDQLWEAVEKTQPRSALLVRSERNELGVGFKQLGEHRYKLCEQHGIMLVSFLEKGKSN
jgi:CRISPR-associated protein Cas2